MIPRSARSPPDTDVAEYTYDANGNRLTQELNSSLVATSTYDDADQLVSDGTNSYTYDDAGNMTAAGADSYSWDWDNRLTSATVSSVTTTFSYDGDNLRTSRTANSVTTDYVWDRVSDLPLVIDDGNHAYLHADGLVGEVDDSDDALYHLTDALGSVRGLTDETGAIVGTTNYAVFGEVNGTSGTSSAYGYTGELRDPTTGLTYLRARYADPSLGRFLSMDTVQPNAPGTQGYNRCAYAANNPATWTDPTGHASDAEVCGALMVMGIAGIWGLSTGWLIAKGPKANFAVAMIAWVGPLSGLSMFLRLMPQSTDMRILEAIGAGVVTSFGGMLHVMLGHVGEGMAKPAAIALLVAGVLIALAAAYIRAIVAITNFTLDMPASVCEAFGRSDEDRRASFQNSRSSQSVFDGGNGSIINAQHSMPSIPGIHRPGVTMS